jgi:Lon protease-like protein
MNPGPHIGDFPATLHLLPSDFLLLPEGALPVIFKDSPLSDVIEAAVASTGYAGVVLPREEAGPARFHSVGCLARLRHVNRDGDGIHVTLEGVIRFRIREELPLDNQPLHRATVSYEEFAHDLRVADEDLSEWNLEAMKDMLVDFGRRQFGSAGVLEVLTPLQVVRFLAQTAPLATAERQAILEARGFREMLEMLMKLLALNYLTTTPDSQQPQVN